MLLQAPNPLEITTDSFLLQTLTELPSVNQVPPSREPFLISRVMQHRVEVLTSLTMKMLDSMTDNYERRHDSMLRHTPDLKGSPEDYSKNKSMIKLAMNEHHVTPVWSESDIEEEKDIFCGKTEMTIDINQDPHLFLEK